MPPPKNSVSFFEKFAVTQVDRVDVSQGKYISSQHLKGSLPVDLALRVSFLMFFPHSLCTELQCYKFNRIFRWPDNNLKYVFHSLGSKLGVFVWCSLKIQSGRGETVVMSEHWLGRFSSGICLPTIFNYCKISAEHS